MSVAWSVIKQASSAYTHTAEAAAHNRITAIVSVKHLKKVEQQFSLFSLHTKLWDSFDLHAHFTPH